MILRIILIAVSIMTNIYVHQDLHEMNLYPCAYSMTFNVTKEPGKDRLTLNAVLNQRSQDILAANNWNVCQYSILLMMIAQVCDMEAGELVHVIADCHIYDRHIPVSQRTDQPYTVSGTYCKTEPGCKGLL